tara:strand:+ start:715 stop:990 length:276 start_codon:yes stop_codon:yes gene_type:complete
LEQDKKSALIHYLEEFVIAIIGIAIFLGLLWYSNFNFSVRILSLWIFLFNGILFTFWLWKSDAKNWEKAIAALLVNRELMQEMNNKLEKLK